MKQIGNSRDYPTKMGYVLKFLRKSERLYIDFKYLRKLEYYLTDYSIIDRYVLKIIRRVNPNYHPSQKKSMYRSIFHNSFEKYMTLYWEECVKLMIEGHTIKLSAGLGEMSIIDVSPVTKKYNIKLGGQDPQLTVKNQANDVLAWNKIRNYHYLFAQMKPKMRKMVEQQILKHGMKYPKLTEYGKYDSYNTSRDINIPGKELQKQAVR